MGESGFVGDEAGVGGEVPGDGEDGEVEGIGEGFGEDFRGGGMADVLAEEGAMQGGEIDQSGVGSDVKSRQSLPM